MSPLTWMSYPARSRPEGAFHMPAWTFITNHGAVLALVSQRGHITARELAETLGITERSVHRIISDLEANGYLERERTGRMNYYTVDGEMGLRGPDDDQSAVAELLRVLAPKNPRQRNALAKRKARLAHQRPLF